MRDCRTVKVKGVVVPFRVREEAYGKKEKLHVYQ